MKMNHAINEGYHYNMEIKSEIKEVKFRLWFGNVLGNK